MKTLLLAFLTVFAISQAKGEESLRVLIVDGFSNHDWEATTRDLQELLSKDPAVKAEVSTVPAQDSETWGSWLPEFSDYEVVIQNTNDISKKGAWPRPAQEALESYVKEGGGLLLFHSANNAFPEWKEYNRMIGLGWRSKDFGPSVKMVDGKPVKIPAGEGDKTGHGKRLDTLITRHGDHPIHENLPLKWMAADLEIYRYARGPAENLTVISSAKEGKTGLHFPIEWVIRYGKGRVYNSTFGHHWHNQKTPPPGIRCMGFRTIFGRAVSWLAGREVDGSVPEGFPGESEVSLAEESPAIPESP